MQSPSRPLSGLLAALVAGAMLQIACSGDAQTNDPVERTSADGGSADGGTSGGVAGEDGGSSDGGTSGKDGGSDGGTGGTDGGTDGGTSGTDGGSPDAGTGGTDGGTDDRTILEVLCGQMGKCTSGLGSAECSEIFSELSTLVVDEGAVRTCLDGTLCTANSINDLVAFASCVGYDEAKTVCKTSSTTAITACNTSGVCKEIDCNEKCIEIGKTSGSCEPKQASGGPGYCSCTPP